jgi:hypothetical protein
MRFGTDFSDVRIHTDSSAARAALRSGARAFTVGEEIVFGRGEWSPDSARGRKLLAHELAHVIQQRRGGPQPGPPLRAALDRDAAHASDAFIAGRPIEVAGASARSAALVPAEPRALRENLIPSQMTAEEVDAEVQAIRAWLAAHPGSAEGRDELLAVLPRLEAVSMRHDLAARQGMSAAIETEKPEPQKPAPSEAKLATPPLPGGRVDQNPLAEAMGAVASFKASDVASGLYAGIVNGQRITINEAQYQEMLAKVRGAVEATLRSVRSRASSAAGRYAEQQKVDAHHWIVAPIVKAVGGVKDPKPYLDAFVATAGKQAAAAEAALRGGDLRAAADAAANAELAAAKASKMVQAYVDQIIDASEMTVTALEYVKTASEIVFLVLATVATAGAGGAAATSVFGLEVGTGTAVTVIGTGSVIAQEVGVGIMRAADGDKVDWGEIATHAAVQIIMARFGGKVGARIGGALVARFGARAASLVTPLLLHEASSAFATVINDAVLALRGKPITMKQFEDELVARMLDPKGLALAVVQSRLAAHLEGQQPPTARPEGETVIKPPPTPHTEPTTKPPPTPHTEPTTKPPPTPAPPGAAPTGDLANVPPTGPSFEDVSTELQLEPSGTITYRSAAAAAAAARQSGLESPTRPGFGSYSTAGSVRKALGPSAAGTQAAHVTPQAVYRALRGTGRPGSAGRALTTPLSPQAHRSLDKTWVAEWNARVAAGQEIQAGDVYGMVSRAIDQADPSLINVQTKGALQDRLRSELFQELGLSPNDVIIPKKSP